ncbi:hypothetical protein A2U01_0116206 [Trifolium medium]|uniref:Uncharacterized protein n=1 Tax=Trifolium medium TaxID=97028 RepID=A0A392W2Q1_9FABA|nr:hypothetical protein [Trifolium medium]
MFSDGIGTSAIRSGIGTEPNGNRNRSGSGHELSSCPSRKKPIHQIPNDSSD